MELPFWGVIADWPDMTVHRMREECLPTLRNTGRLTLVVDARGEDVCM